MLVVADSSPLNYLIRLDYVRFVPHLFERVAVPPAVVQETTSPDTPAVVREFMRQPPSWLTIVTPECVEPIAGLDQGEVEAISLVRQVGASALLIDDHDGRRAAKARSITVIGTVGVLEAAAGQRLVDLELAFRRLLETDFRIPAEFLEDRLRLFRAHRNPGA